MKLTFLAHQVCALAMMGSLLESSKEFLMDHVNRSSFKNVTLHSRRVRNLMKRLAELYQNNKRLQFLALKQLSLSLGLESVYLKMPAVGKLLVSYEITGQTLRVRVDYGKASRNGLEKVVILNEQSANFFRVYQDSSLPDFVDQIPAWERVRSKWVAC